MPENAPAIKRARVLADGAEVVTVGNASAERQAVAERLAAERGLAMIPPYDDDRIIAGQGTCGLEIAEDLPDLAAVLVPIGGGGLASGVRRGREGAPPGGAGRRRGAGAGGRRRGSRWPGARSSSGPRPTSRGRSPTARGRRPSGVRTFAHLRALLDDIVTVSEEEIAAAVRIAAEEARLVVEPSGALSIAALRFRAAAAGVAERGRPGRLRRLRRQRRPGALPRLPRGADPLDLTVGRRQAPEQAGRRRAPGGPRAHPRRPRAGALTPPRPASRRRSR